MNKKYIVAGMLFTVALAFISCTEEISDINYGNSPVRLSVFGTITTDTTSHEVILSKTGNLTDSSFRAVTNADVTITDGTNIFQLTEDSKKPGTYRTAPSVYGVPGRTYTLNINNVDINGDGTMEQYAAKSELRSENPIDSIHVLYDNSNPDRAGWYVNMFTKDPGGRNFYLVKALKNNDMLTDSIYKYNFITDNSSFEGKYFYGLGVYFLDQKKDREKLNIKDTVQIELCSITEEYFHFIFDYITEYYPKVPIFSGASSNVSTNIEPANSAVGFFAAYSIKRKSTIYHGEKVKN